MTIEATDSFEIALGDDHSSRVSSFASLDRGQDSAKERKHYVIEGADSIEVQAPFRNFASIRPSQSSVGNDSTVAAEIIEVHPIGKGLVDYTSVYTNDTSSCSVISSDGNNNSDKKKSKKSERRIRPYTLIAFFLFVLCLIIGLGSGIRKTKKVASNQASAVSSDSDVPETTSPVDSNSVSDSSDGTVDSSDEINDNNNTVANAAQDDVDEADGGDVTSEGVDGLESDTEDSDDVINQDGSDGTVPARDDVTASPTSTQTEAESEAGTMEDTMGGTGGGECPEHSVVATSTCQGDLDSTSSLISFCFQSTADGDWYWIRSTDENINYDSWEYMDGASEGSVELFDLQQGTYKASIVRDSMKPYIIIATAEFTVPDCST
jgi:cytoskeletal protein RodZ